MVFRRHYCKVLALLVFLCLVSVMLYSVRIESLYEETLDEVNDEVTTSDPFSSEASIEEDIEEEEVEPYWDLFKHSDIQPDKDLFFIESSR